MKRLALAAPILAALLAACASPGPQSPASATITPQPVAYWSGSGVVQSVTPAPGQIAAGPRRDSGKVADPQPSGMQRLRIRMDDGRMLYVDTPAKDFQPGTRVQLSDANEIRRL